jgi:alkaline phosphatase D
MARRIDRRSFLKGSSTAALGAAVTLLNPPCAGAASEKSFRSAWPPQVERPWPGPEYWSNPLEDWRIRRGRLECFRAGGDRNVFLLTRMVAERQGTLTMSVRFGLLEGGAEKLDQGFVGFRVGIKSFVDDYRARAVHGRGMNAGVAGDGRLFIGKLEGRAPRISLRQSSRLTLQARASAHNYLVSLCATGSRGEELGEITRQVPNAWLTGGVALVCSSGKIEPTPQPLGEPTADRFYPPDQERGGTMRFWFADWTLDGTKVDVHKERAYGPIHALHAEPGHTQAISSIPPYGECAKTGLIANQERQPALEDRCHGRARLGCVERGLPGPLMGRYPRSSVPVGLFAA